MELWNSRDLCRSAGAVESIGALEQLWRALEQLQTTTLRGEPLNCLLPSMKLTFWPLICVAMIIHCFQFSLFP